MTPQGVTMRSSDGFTTGYRLEAGAQLSKDGRNVTVSSLAAGDQGLVVADRVGPELFAQTVTIP